MSSPSSPDLPPHESVSGAGRPRVVLVGPPGGGKSTVGAVVAERLGAALLDTDRMVAHRGGAPVGELIVDLGGGWLP
ncbi:shikimate kinase [Georgenia sp. SUBG003]|uniref:shikimate kinase n=1 Tax=Georgenia sp. SUBG003 TaxID=1497974 RepID=UPI003AB63402